MFITDTYSQNKYYIQNFIYIYILRNLFSEYVSFKYLYKYLNTDSQNEYLNNIFGHFLQKYYSCHLILRI